jgi:hypothetical protein
METPEEYNPLSGRSARRKLGETVVLISHFEKNEQEIIMGVLETTYFRKQKKVQIRTHCA